MRRASCKRRGLADEARHRWGGRYEAAWRCFFTAVVLRRSSITGSAPAARCDGEVGEARTKSWNKEVRSGVHREWRASGGGASAQVPMRDGAPTVGGGQMALAGQ
jgi:hypothetical protein